MKLINNIYEKNEIFIINNFLLDLQVYANIYKFFIKFLRERQNWK